MKVVIPGGTGQVGTLLARAFVRAGHQVVVLARHRVEAPWPVVVWAPPQRGDWVREFDGADVVINLAGRSVNCRYTDANRRDILESRVRSVEAVARAMAQVAHPPSVWLQASTATIYAHTYGEPHDEVSGVLGGYESGVPETWRFSVQVAAAWEQAFADAAVHHTRKVALRSAMVMSADRGGVFDTLLWLVRVGLGGTSGHGRQFVSWIHELDFVRAVTLLIDRADISGPVNLSSPVPVSNRQFMAALRRAWGARIGLPSSEWMLEMGARLLRTETELVLKSRRVVPGRLLGAGFTFTYPEWPEAARELCQRWR